MQGLYGQSSPSDCFLPENPAVMSKPSKTTKIKKNIPYVSLFMKIHSAVPWAIVWACCLCNWHICCHSFRSKHWCSFPAQAKSGWYEHPLLTFDPCSVSESRNSSYCTKFLNCQSTCRLGSLLELPAGGALVYFIFWIVVQQACLPHQWRTNKHSCFCATIPYNQKQHDLLLCLSHACLIPQGAWVVNIFNRFHGKYMARFLNVFPSHGNVTLILNMIHVFHQNLWRCCRWNRWNNQQIFSFRWLQFPSKFITNS